MTSLPVHADPALSLAERAYRTLRDRLVVLDIAPGDPLQESRLAEELEVGRTPLREAIKRLEVDRLVVSYPRRGTFATGVDITELATVSEVRELLEPLAARKAALRADPEVRQALREAHESVAHLADGSPWREALAADLAVHRLIYRAAGNPHLEDSLIRLDNLATRIWSAMVDRLPDVSVHVREHIALLEAILAGDADRAEQLTLDHIHHFDAMVRQVI